MRAGLGDMYAGVFANDDSWRDAVVDAGNASGDLAWPWPLHPRYRSLIESTVADLRNTAGKSFGFPIVAATFLAQFAGEGRGRMSTCSVRRCSTRIAATRSAAVRPATASACSSSSPRAWPSERQARGASSPAMTTSADPGQEIGPDANAVRGSPPELQPDQRHHERADAEDAGARARLETPSRPRLRAGQDVVEPQGHEQAEDRPRRPARRRRVSTRERRGTGRTSRARRR